MTFFMKNLTWEVLLPKYVKFYEDLIGLRLRTWLTCLLMVVSGIRSCPGASQTHYAARVRAIQ